MSFRYRPETKRRAQWRWLASGTALLVGLGSWGTARATVIRVDATADEDGSGSGCSLREAIKAANTDTAYGGCPAGSGDDFLYLFSTTSPATFALTRTQSLAITGDMTLDGAGHIIKGGASGGFDVKSGTVRFTSVRLTGFTNATPLIVRSVVSMDYSQIYSNKTTSVPQQTFGIWVVAGGFLTATDSTLRDNAAIKGGGIYNNAGTVELTNVTIANNSSSQYGGGIMTVGGGYAELHNCTISGNSATGYYGGGIYNGGNSFTMVYGSTIVNNTAQRQGGGIFDDASTYSGVAIRNTIVANNVSRSGATFGGCSGTVYSYS
ncbi:MAG TPA: CSLREA domain-containing protein, partial [Polyangia bacterium]|nr:CSLREA domain-containing protein [Polyangia bacterium]